MEHLSESNEDYLEAMVMLGASQTQSVRAVDVAEKMGVSQPAITKAVRALREKGFVNQPLYGDIVLTAAGEEYGKSVLARHEALTSFLNKAVGIDAETAEKEACLMEHAISDDSFAKWMKFIDGLNLA